MPVPASRSLPLAISLGCCLSMHAYAMPVHVDVVLHPGKTQQECFALEVGQRVEYSFTMDPPGSFGLQARRAKKEGAYVLRSESVRQQKGDHVAVAAQEYCLTWMGDARRDTRLGYEFIVAEPGLSKH
jgi:hypothetical protein